jgi:hypothetical protein
MTMTMQGTIERKGFGTGVWALVTDEGQVYELKQAPKDLLKSGTRVTIHGDIQTDAVSFAMIGPILLVQSMEPLN